ncbi:hypothetical protein B0H17DRAFT_1135968 [Mycena rosella]|uniref:Uncharacterized protein n=1 Tax=Mycena rosella TaxID=1033263 RepID=A0AAD7DCA8_MYCRO|nr:hypothetical protein B0H17DRAFT_1135968 [Mycena rosella]
MNRVAARIHLIHSGPFVQIVDIFTAYNHVPDVLLLSTHPSRAIAPRTPKMAYSVGELGHRLRAGGSTYEKVDEGRRYSRALDWSNGNAVRIGPVGRRCIGREMRLARATGTRRTPDANLQIAVGSVRLTVGRQVEFQAKLRWDLSPSALIGLKMNRNNPMTQHCLTEDFEKTGTYTK